MRHELSVDYVMKERIKSIVASESTKLGNRVFCKQFYIVISGKSILYEVVQYTQLVTTLSHTRMFDNVKDAVEYYNTVDYDF